MNHHDICPKGERCACYLTGYTDAEYDHGLAKDSLAATPSGGGEWTVTVHPERSDRFTCRFGQLVFVCLDSEREHYQRIADAHNAALRDCGNDTKRRAFVDYVASIRGFGGAGEAYSILGTVISQAKEIAAMLETGEQKHEWKPDIKDTVT